MHNHQHSGISFNVKHVIFNSVSAMGDLRHPNKVSFNFFSTGRVKLFLYPSKYALVRG